MTEEMLFVIGVAALFGIVLSLVKAGWSVASQRRHDGLDSDLSDLKRSVRTTEEEYEEQRGKLSQ